LSDICSIFNYIIYNKIRKWEIEWLYTKIINSCSFGLFPFLFCLAFLMLGLFLGRLEFFLHFFSDLLQFFFSWLCGFLSRLFDLLGIRRFSFTLFSGVGFHVFFRFLRFLRHFLILILICHFRYKACIGVYREILYSVSFLYFSSKILLLSFIILYLIILLFWLKFSTSDQILFFTKFVIKYTIKLIQNCN
jgi:hypothetical protein